MNEISTIQITFANGEVLTSSNNVNIDQALYAAARLIASAIQMTEMPLDETLTMVKDDVLDILEEDAENE